MKPAASRLILWLVLFLSLGFNLGLVVSRLTERPVEPSAPPAFGGAAADQVPRWLERIVVRVADELGLLGAEREQFFDLQREFFRRTMEARRVQRRHEFAVRRLLVSGRAERAEVEEALGRVVSAQREVEQAFLDHYFAARELLDEHQMLRYQHFLGQLRRASQELGDAGPDRQGRPGRQGRRP